MEAVDSKRFNCFQHIQIKEKINLAIILGIIGLAIIFCMLPKNGKGKKRKKDK